jgi:hypothetical protein
LYKTFTLMLYNLINHPNLMGAHCSCGQCNQALPSPPREHEEAGAWSNWTQQCWIM